MTQRYINKELKSSKVKVRFSERAYEDLTSFDKGQQVKVIAAIIRRGKAGPLIKPHGVGDPLRKELSGFTKITMKRMGIRVVYKPIKNTKIEMGIIVVGPRRNNRVYNTAIRRLVQFDKEMAD